jgi:hypothetical protein
VYYPPVGSHPINLALRFLLELAALAALAATAAWGWRYADGGLLRYVLAIGIPIGVAVAWGIFAVPDDPSRSGKAPVAVPGILRLLLEVAVFVFAAWALYNTGLATLSWILTIMVLAHYVASYDRVLWLVKQVGGASAAE